MRAYAERVREWGFRIRPYHSRYSPYNKVINAAISGEVTVGQIPRIHAMLERMYEQR